MSYSWTNKLNTYKLNITEIWNLSIVRHFRKNREHNVALLAAGLCMFYHNFYRIFSCYLPSTKSGLRHLHSCNFFLIGIVEGGWSPFGSTRHCGHQWPIVPAPGDNDDGEIGGMIGRGNRSTRRKSAKVPLCPPQAPHAARTRTWAAAVGSQRLTAWATARPLHSCSYTDMGCAVIEVSSLKRTQQSRCLPFTWRKKQIQFPKSCVV
jgi:hypothetical protein